MKFAQKIITASILASLSTTTLAVTEQIQDAEYYIAELENIEYYFSNPDRAFLKPSMQPLVDFIKSADEEERYRILNDTKTIEPPRKFKKGDKSNLIMSYQKASGINADGVFGSETEELVKNKQKLVNLEPTGELDENTFFDTYIHPLHVQKQLLIDSIKENERILQKQNEMIENKRRGVDTSKFIVVNIPSQTLSAYSYHNGRTKLEFSTKVVVGSKRKRTPLEDMFIYALKYNPTWTPTNNMLKKNLFKNNELNEKWLTSHNIKIFKSNGEEVGIEEYKENRPQNVSFVQPAGEDNALGLLKFETNSKNNIYLHDTNEKKYFKYNTRAYSSGCVRVDDFISLAEFVSNKSPKHIEENIANNETKIVKNYALVPVYISYSRAVFKDDMYEPHFYPDLYKRWSDNAQ